MGGWTLADSIRKRRAIGVHLLNVFAHEVQQVIWQMPVSEKRNETSALKHSPGDLLATYPFLQLLTGDAMFAGEALCAELIGHGRHYVFQIKADQKHLLEKMEQVLAGRL